MFILDMFGGGFHGRGGFNMGFRGGMNMPPRFMRRPMHNPFMGMGPMGGRGMRLVSAFYNIAIFRCPVYNNRVLSLGLYLALESLAIELFC